LVIFSILGHMAHVQSKDISEVATAGELYCVRVLFVFSVHTTVGSPDRCGVLFCVARILRNTRYFSSKALLNA